MGANGGGRAGNVRCIRYRLGRANFREYGNVGRGRKAKASARRVCGGVGELRELRRKRKGDPISEKP